MCFGLLFLPSAQSCERNQLKMYSITLELTHLYETVVYVWNIVYMSEFREWGINQRSPRPVFGRDRHGHLLESPADVSRRAVPTSRCSFWVGIVYEQSRRELFVMKECSLRLITYVRSLCVDLYSYFAAVQSLPCREACFSYGSLLVYLAG